MALQELLKLLLAKHPSTTSFTLFPVSHIFIRVIPEQISNQSRVWDISRLRKLFDLVEAMHVFAEATVHAHDLFIDKGYKRQVVEAIVEGLPK